MPISIPLPIAKGGTGQAATGGDDAFAAGFDCVASQAGCVAVGSINTASGSDFCSAIGTGNTASNNQDCAFGNANIASGGLSSAFGFENISSASESNAFGANNWAYGTRSNAFGYGCYGGGTNSSAFGYFNTVLTPALNSSAFGYGNNITSGERSSAFGYRNTSSGVESVAFGTTNNATGSDSSALGRYNSVTAAGSTAAGHNNTISGEFATAHGRYNAVSGFAASAFGDTNEATGSLASSIGRLNAANATRSQAVGTYNFAYGTNSNAFGYGCYGGGTNTSAFGYFVQSPVANTAEFGYWPNQAQRGGAIRTDSTGTTAFTYNTSSTALTDGGATAGSEAAGTLPRGMYAMRHDGDGQTFMDVNDAGVIETKNITSIFGQATSGAGSVAIAVSGTYYKLTTAATLDSGNTSHMALNAGQITLQNTSGYTRRFLVTAYINASSNNQKTMIGLRIGKNGTSYADSEARSFSDDTAHPVGITTSYIVSMNDNDYADIYVSNHTDTDTVTINAARILAHSID